MKRILFISMLALLGISTAQAQSIRFGIKAGANFSNIDAEDIETDNMTSWHAGAVLELNVLPNFSIQPEAMYSSQGAKVEGPDDFKLDYISVPVLARFYILPDLLSLDAGPQFSFLMNDNFADFDGIGEDFKAKNFDFAVIGGATVNITDSFFGSARYVIGLTEASEEAKVTNKVIQLSVGYRF